MVYRKNIRIYYFINKRITSESSGDRKQVGLSFFNTGNIIQPAVIATSL